MFGQNEIKCTWILNLVSRKMLQVSKQVKAVKKIAYAKVAANVASEMLFILFGILALLLVLYH